MCYDDGRPADRNPVVYRWDEETYTALAAAGIHWREVFEVLYEAWPRMRKPTAEEIDSGRPEERRTTMAVSRTVRMPPQTFALLHAEADRRGIGVTTLMRELIETGLAALDEDRAVTVRLGDLHRAIDVAALRHAA